MNVRMALTYEAIGKKAMHEAINMKEKRRLEAAFFIRGCTVHRTTLNVRRVRMREPSRMVTTYTPGCSSLVDTSAR